MCFCKSEPLSRRFGAGQLDMSTEKAFEISWTQLPQRALWSSLSERKSDQKQALSRSQSRSKVGKPYKATIPAEEQPGGWEYLDHTADVQIHSWGSDLNEAFGAAVTGMFGYMVEIDEIDNDLEVQIAVEGHDLHSLLYSMMSECLYCFHTEQFVGKQVIVNYLDKNDWKLQAIVRGGLFDPTSHSQGTEIKAITYSNMQVIERRDGRVETYVIVDI